MPTDPLPSSPPRRRSWAERDLDWSQRLHRAGARPRLVRGLIAVSWLSDGPIWYACIVVLPFLAGPVGTACALRMLALGAINLAIYRIVKRYFARPRPYASCPDIRACARALDEFSFPSGHTLHAVAFGGLLCIYWPLLGWIVWPFVALVALSRVVLGLHYPSDVAMGALLGALTLQGVLALF